MVYYGPPSIYYLSYLLITDKFFIMLKYDVKHKEQTV